VAKTGPSTETGYRTLAFCNLRRFVFSSWLDWRAAACALSLACIHSQPEGTVYSAACQSQTCGFLLQSDHSTAPRTVDVLLAPIVHA